MGPVLLPRQLGRLVGGSWLKAKVMHGSPETLDDREILLIQICLFPCCLAPPNNRIKRNAWFYHPLREVTSFSHWCFVTIIASSVSSRQHQPWPGSSLAELLSASEYHVTTREGASGVVSKEVDTGCIL